ncbi:Putative protein y4gI [Picochlorum sp. SENEW3]|nr:Putative protein y4gI [Picochlorum sp. SENEW3]WPT18571.1 y4gI [Picochlorum sp. SENEW3]
MVGLSAYLVWLVFFKPAVYWTRYSEIVRLNDKLRQQPFLGGCFEDQAILRVLGPICARGSLRKSDVVPWHRRLGKTEFSVLKENLKIGKDVSVIRDGKRDKKNHHHDQDADPLISVVMPFYNQGLMTCQSVHELAQDSAKFKMEVIVVDDESSLEEVSIVKSCLRGMSAWYDFRYTYVRNDVSEGYSFSCNKGAEMARGSVLLFANNDMFVSNGAVGALINTLVTYPKAGIVGPLFLGQRDIQELGGVIYNQAGAANAFRGHTQVPKQLLMAHQVDYISAACIAMEKDVFIELGGFDRAYGRGYYEDTDLAMAVRHIGLRVVLQPFAVVYHQEGNTFGADSKEKRSLMSKNKQVFREKWKDALVHHMPEGTPFLETRERYMTNLVLWIDQVIPTPSYDSGSQRMWEILRYLLNSDVQVDFLPIHYFIPQEWLADVAFIRSRGIRLQPNKNETLCGKTMCPYKAIFIARPNTAEEVIKLVDRCCSGVPIVYDTVDLHFLRESRELLQQNKEGYASPEEAVQLALCGKGKNLEKSKECIEHMIMTTNPSAEVTADLVVNVTKVYKRLQSELDIVTRSVTTFVMSDVEDHVLQSQGMPASKMKLISNIYPDESISMGRKLVQDESSYVEKRNGGIFVGSFQHVPNIVAVRNLIRITDAIRTRHPDFVMHIVGSHHPPEDLHKQLKNHRGIRFHGFMADDDLTALYSQVMCAIVPLSTGAGVKGKVAAAYLHGIPVIGSRIALEGMGLNTDVDCFLAEELDEYVESYSSFRHNPELARQFASHGLEKIASTFSYSRATQLLDEVLRSLIISTDRDVTL